MRYHDAAGCPKPLEVEQVARWIFEAGKRLGTPQPFLARELAEGACHFICADLDPDEPIAEAELHDKIETAVRSLGHPHLARAYRESPRRETPAPESRPGPGPNFDVWRGQRVRDAVALDEVYPPDLISAHEEGWLVLARPVGPLELDGAAIPGGPRMLEAIRSARESVAGLVAIDGADLTLAREPGDPDESAERFAREVDFAAGAYGLTATIHLNPADPPPWDAPLAGGDLFAATHSAPDPERVRRVQQTLLAALARTANARPVWHWRDAFPERLPVGVRLCHDEEGAPVDLGFGLTRERPYALGSVGVDLRKFLERLGSEPDAEVLKKKWMSLARLARAAGYARREFLRRHGRPAVREQFRLDRAGWVVSPLNLGAAAEILAGDEASSPGAVFRHARNIIAAFAEALERDGERGLGCSLEWTEFPADDPCFAALPPSLVVRRLRQLQKDGLLSPFPLASPDAELCRGLARVEVRP